MAKIPFRSQSVSARTGVSGSGRIPVTAFAGLERAQEKLVEAATGLGETLVAGEQQKEAAQTEREENDWITKTTASSVEKWTLGSQEAQAAAQEGAPEYTPQFMDTFDKWLPTVLDQAPTRRAREDFADRMVTLRGKMLANASEFEARAGRAARLSNFTTAMDQYAGSAAMDSSQVPGLIAAASGDLAAAEATWMLPEQVTEFRDIIAPNLAAAGFQGDILKDPEGVLQTVSQSEPGDGSLAGLLSSVQRTKLETNARAEINRRKTGVAIEKNGLKLEMTDISTILDAGLDVGAERMNAVQNQVDLIGDPAMKVRMRNIQQQAVLTKEFRTWQPAELQGWINNKRSSLSGKSATQADAAVLASAESMLTEMNTQLRNDPLIWASRSGQTVEPISFHGEGAVESMQARREMAAGFADDYQIEPRYLTNEDERALISIFSKGSAEEKVLVMSNITQGFGPESTNIFARISKDNRVMAHAGGLANMGPQQLKNSVQIVNGQESIKAGIDVLPGPTDLNQWTSEYTNGSLSMVPQTLGSVIEAAKAIYTDRAIKSAPEEGDGQRDLWEQSIDAALGGFEIDTTFGSTIYGSIGKWNDFGVVLPKDIDQGRFANLINSVSDEDLKAASVGGAAPVINDRDRRPLTAEMFRKARLSSVGEGQYMVDLTHIGVDFALGSGPSGKYIFDLTRIIPALNLRADVLEDQAIDVNKFELRRALQRGGQRADTSAGARSGFGRVR